MKNSWIQMVPKSILLCLPVFLCHSLTGAMAQSASYYSIKQKFWWPAFSLLDRHQKMFKVSRWSGRNPPKPGCALHWEGERTPFATTSPNHFLTAINTATCFVWQSQLFGKDTIAGWQQIEKGKINRLCRLHFLPQHRESWSYILHY